MRQTTAKGPQPVQTDEQPAEQSAIAADTFSTQPPGGRWRDASSNNGKPVMRSVRRVFSVRGAQGRSSVELIADKPGMIPQTWQRKTGRAASMIESFYHAFRGIAVGLKEQRNLRIHFSAVVLVLGLGLGLHVDTNSWIALTVAMALVIAAEFLNTALEHLVDIASGGQFHESARNAKDTAAAAVLVASIAAGVIGALVFVPRLLQLLPH